jgi:phenylacetate-CoA ligase
MPRPLPPLSPFLSWPPYIATPHAALRDVVRGLEASDRWSAAELAAGTQSQLMLLLEWAANNVPYYRTQGSLMTALKILRRSPGRFEEQWLQLPLLAKATLRSDGPALNAPVVPHPHLPLAAARTSGSTGIPVEIRTTAVTRIVWDALGLREHHWHQRNFSRRLGAIRYCLQKDRNPRGADRATWGPPVADLYRTGPASVMHIGEPLDRLVDWLRRFDPHYLLTYPSVAAALLEALGPAGKPPALEEIRLMAEPLDVELENRLVSAWSVRVSDIYTSNECGQIAFRCREHNKLHVQSEGIYVEILDKRGARCETGETGQVVLTSLHNLATPLIRYQIGDYATVGETCGCGRASPVIRQVLGRVRNLALSPDGRRYWPTALGKTRVITAIRQAQWVQTARDAIELRVVLDRPLTMAETQMAIDTVCKALGYPYRVEIVAVEAIARGPTGKFEEFLSLLDEARL